MNPVKILISMATETVATAQTATRIARALALRLCTRPHSTPAPTATHADAPGRGTDANPHPNATPPVPADAHAMLGTAYDTEGTRMARKVTVVLQDDLTGEVLDEGSGETVSFGLDGQTYEIDLSQDNADELRRALGRYTNAARRTGTGRRSADRRHPSPSRRPHRDTAAIRTWAREHGYQVSQRGRIPTTVLAAYDAAH